LGAVLCALGFEKTLPFVHGSQGCVAYFRSHFSRHFKEPIPAVSSSMTEDAAVFGGLSNMIEGLENAYIIYRPKMMAVSTTCMAEVIGDDLNAFIKKAREKQNLPEDLIITYAHTPSFVGSHIVGYDNMMKGILSQLTQGRKREPNGKINFIPGFETYTGNIRELKRILEIMDVDYTILADNSEMLDSPNYGDYKLYHGGTKIEDAMDAINSIGTISLQKYSSMKTGEFIEDKFEHPYIAGPYPVGIKNTDIFLENI
jgi:nitrogenase molybdenum-iron protein beta chain